MLARPRGTTRAFGARGHATHYSRPPRCPRGHAAHPHPPRHPPGYLDTEAAAAAGTPISRGALRARYADFYEGQRLVRVLPDGETPDVQRHGTGCHGATLGGWTWDAATGRFALVSCIDNLLKGAATQAVQHINLACGLPELEGIDTPGQRF